MSETDELYTSVNYIKHKVESIEKIELLNLRSNCVLRERYIETLRDDNILYQVYKVIDGKKSQKEIAKIVNTTDMTISRKVRALAEIGLIEIKNVTLQNENIYKHSIAEHAFKLIKAIG